METDNEELREEGHSSRKTKVGLPPVCFNHNDCFACSRGHCMVLICNDFEGRDCPFYRNEADNQKEQEECMRRLARIGRRDLLDKYRKDLTEAGAFEQDFTGGVADDIKAYRSQGIW